MRSLALAALVVAGKAGAQARSQLEVLLPVPAAAATARVQSSFADDGLALSPNTASGVEGAEQFRALHIVYRAAVIAVDSAHSRVVLTAWGSTPGFGVVHGNEAQATSKTGGYGKRAWSRLERLAGKISATT